MLEMNGVMVCVYGVDEFLVFFMRLSGCEVLVCVDMFLEAAKVIDAGLRLNLNSGSVFVVLILFEYEVLGVSIESVMVCVLCEIEE